MYLDKLRTRLFTTMICVEKKKKDNNIILYNLKTRK